MFKCTQIIANYKNIKCHICYISYSLSLRKRFSDCRVMPKYEAICCCETRLNISGKYSSSISKRSFAFLVSRVKVLSRVAQ